MSTPERWRTTTEVSRELRCAASTVRRWVQTGVLPAVRVNRRLLIPAHAVEALVTALTEARNDAK
jgi:excisionase family DNA binding protein